MLRRQFANVGQLENYIAKRDFAGYIKTIPTEHIDQFLAGPDAYLGGRMKPPGLLSELHYQAVNDRGGNPIVPGLNAVKMAMLSPSELVKEFNIRLKAKRRDRGGPAVVADNAAHDAAVMTHLTNLLTSGQLSLDTIVDANTTRHTVVDLPDTDQEGYIAMGAAGSHIKRGDVIDVIRIPPANPAGNPTFRIINRTQEAYLLEDGLKGTAWSKGGAAKGTGRKRGRPRKKKTTVVATANA